MRSHAHGTVASAVDTTHVQQATTAPTAGRYLLGGAAPLLGKHSSAGRTSVRSGSSGPRPITSDLAKRSSTWPLLAVATGARPDRCRPRTGTVVSVVQWPYGAARRPPAPHVAAVAWYLARSVVSPLPEAPVPEGRGAPGSGTGDGRTWCAATEARGVRAALLNLRRQQGDRGAVGDDAFKSTARRGCGAATEGAGGGA